jgi:CheY-like chemotaxis protein
MENREERNILLVDTSVTTRKLLAMRLSSMELETVEAENAEAIERAFSTMNIQLVVTEWKVQGLEGRDLFKKLQKRNVPVLLFTDKLPKDDGGDWKVPELKGVFHKSQRAELLKRIEEHFEPKPPEEKGEQGCGCHILLIEDSPTIRGLLRRIIQKNFPDCVIREAEEGRQAISEMTNKKVDFIVTDLQMPGMDGKSFLKILHGNPVLKNKPVLVLSGAITAELRAEFKSWETVRLLAKPSSEDEIAETIKELMELTEPTMRLNGREKDLI